MTTVRDNPEKNRYEIRDGEELAGFCEYRLSPGKIAFIHTEVDPALEGQGIGGQLVRGALDHARTLGVRVLPICPFAQAWMARHPGYVDLDYRSPATRATD